MYPPQDPKDLVKVPIITSTSLGLTPCCSQTPLPVAPRAPMEWASSKYRYAPYFFFNRTISLSRTISPSME